MPRQRIQSFGSLRDEMVAVAKGERKAPTNAAAPSVHSAEVLARLLTPENREMMSVIRDAKPSSVADLANLTQRAAPNVTRTLDKLAAVGLVKFVAEGRKKAPRMAVRKITIEMDPFSSNDVVVVTPAGLVTRSAKDRRRSSSAATPRSERGPKPAKRGSNAKHRHASTAHSSKGRRG